MLGNSSQGRYYIYYAALTNIHALAAKELPRNVTDCTGHALTEDSRVMVTCADLQGRSYVVVMGGLGEDGWQLGASRRLV